MTTTAPILTGQTLGLAHYATRAALERLLTGTHVDFTHWLAVNAVGTGRASSRSGVVDLMTFGLKIEKPTAENVVDDVLADGTLTGDIQLTASGQVLFDKISAASAELTKRFYGDLPSEYLAETARVLTIVTERANALLAK
jgi:hypothetical protein